MLKAKLDSVRKNKKGFSLVELIIVIAIMVALIAVMAPSFIKYVKKSRDAAMETAAEDFVSAIKTEFADPESDWARPSSDVKLKLAQNTNSQAVITIESGSLKTTGDAAVDANAIMAKAGLDSTKKMGASKLYFNITITSNGNVTLEKKEAA